MGVKCARQSCASGGLGCGMRCVLRARCARLSGARGQTGAKVLPIDLQRDGAVSPRFTVRSLKPLHLCTMKMSSRYRHSCATHHDIVIMEYDAFSSSSGNGVPGRRGPMGRRRRGRRRRRQLRRQMKRQRRRPREHVLSPRGARRGEARAREQAEAAAAAAQEEEAGFSRLQRWQRRRGRRRRLAWRAGGAGGGRGSRPRAECEGRAGPGGGG